MKKALLLSAVFLPVLTSLACAGGININWGGGCWNDGVPLANKTFDCATNSGTATMTSSFAVSQDMLQFTRIDVDLEGLTEAASVPGWWQLGAGDCRSAGLTATADFTTGTPFLGCWDLWEGRAYGRIIRYAWGPPAGGSNRMQILLWFGLPPGATTVAVAGAEYYGCKVRVNYLKTVGAGSCTGCSDRLIWTLCGIRASQQDGSYEDLTEVLPSGNQCLTWQGSTLPCPEYGCSTIVPTRNNTWGQVKSLYR